MLNATNDTIACTASLSPRARAFLREPSFVFERPVPVPSRSEQLRAQIVAAQDMRR